MALDRINATALLDGGITSADLATQTGNVDFADNARIRLGDSQDLQIYHDGSHSYIEDAGEGSLFIKAQDFIVLENTAGDNYFAGETGGPATLYHAGVRKLQTTTTGVDVTGTVTADGLDISGSSGATLTLTSTDTTGADTELLGQIDFVSSDVSSGSAGTQARIKGVYEDNGDSSGIAFLTGASTGSGSPTIDEVMRIRHEGKVGIGTTSPNELLEVNSTGASTAIEIRAGLASTTTGEAKLVLRSLHSSSGTVYSRSEIASLGVAGGDSDLIFRTTTDASGPVERMRIDSEGNVTIQPAGTTTRSFNETVAIKEDQSGTTRLSVRNDTNDSNSSAGFVASSAGNSWAIECGSAVKNGNALTFALDATAATPSEKMRLDTSGNLLVGATSNTGSGASSGKQVIRFNGTIGNALYCDDTRTSSGNDVAIIFGRGATAVGTIVTTLSSTSYNTPSDYRLKENVVADWDATTRLKQLNPVRFNFISDADNTVDGFLAHEVQDIVPEAITGEKDAMRDEEYEVTPAVLDEDGNEVTPAVMGTRSVPDYQGIDQGKLVPLLVKSLQEALDKIDTLETRLEALENA